MNEFSEAIFEKKLLELRDSQKEIQSLSQYCVHNRQNCKIVVKVTFALYSSMNDLDFQGLVQKFEKPSSGTKVDLDVSGQ